MNENVDKCGTCLAVDRKSARIAQKEKPKKKALKRVSDKRKVETDIYTPLRNEWIVGKFCAVCVGEFPELPPLPAEDCHHMAGKEGKLLIDTRYWLPICRGHHTFITEHSAWAIERGYSVSRNKNKSEIF